MEEVVDSVAEQGSYNQEIQAEKEIACKAFFHWDFVDYVETAEGEEFVKEKSNVVENVNRACDCVSYDCAADCLGDVCVVEKHELG